MGCLDDNVAVEFASGAMPAGATAKVEAHLATCRDCRMLVAALAPGPGEPDSDLATPLRPPLGKRGARELALMSTDARRASEPRRPIDPMVSVGDSIGRYVVLRRIGAGGMGVVYAAYDPQLDRRVALKLLRTGVGLGEGEARARLVREAQAIAQLSHPHVVAVYDVGTASGGDVYIAMEFVEGDTLTTWLSRWERTWREVVEMFVDAGRGLAAAHAVGLLHRDFKPDNVLVGADGRVRVTDFGLARSLVTGGDDEGQAPRDLMPLRVTLTATGAVMGTPRYMAPEQLAGKDVTAAADQFSFCVALYEAMFGQHPFLGDTAAKMLDEGARMRRPTELRGAPPALLAILLRGLDPVPARRFPSVAALLAEIGHAVRPPRRRYVAIAGAAALVLGGAAAATVITPRRAGERVDPTLVAQLTAEVQQLHTELERARVEKKELVEQIKRAPDPVQIDKLAEQLAASQTRIKVLEAQLEEVSSKLPTVKPPRPPAGPPPRPADPDAKVVRVALRTMIDPIESCYHEWRERNPDADAAVVVHVRVEPDGRVVHAFAETVLSVQGNDRPLRECVEALAANLTLPPSELPTQFDLHTSMDRTDRIAIDVTDLVHRAPNPKIDVGP